MEKEPDILKKRAPLSTDLRPTLKIDQGLTSDSLRRQAIEKIKQNKEHRIKETEEKFVKKFGQGAINKEMQEIAPINDNNPTRELVLAEFFDSQINNYGWFGENARAILLSDVDRANKDRGKNKGDLLVEIQDKQTGELLHFIIDVTFVGDPDKGTNMQKIKSHNLKEAKMETLRYPRGIKDKSIIDPNRFPKVVVGLDDKNLTSIMSFGYVENKTQDVIDVLDGSPCQIIILEEIVRQLERYAEYVELKNKVPQEKHLKFIETYKKLASILANVQREKLFRAGYDSVQEYFEAVGRKYKIDCRTKSPDEICNAIIQYLEDPRFMEGGYKTG